MTKTQLNKIKARSDAATNGPWKIKCDTDWFEFEDSFCIVDAEDDQLMTGQADRGWFYRKENAEFVAHARKDVPTLIQEICDLYNLIATFTIFDSEEIAEKVNVKLKAWNEY